jgi:hypothetical protein
MAGGVYDSFGDAELLDDLLSSAGTWTRLSTRHVKTFVMAR